MLIFPPLERGQPKPLYEQLYRHIRARIESGELGAGEALPSRREMSSLCGVSVITVENAYAQLTAEGFVRAKARKGFFVEAIERVPQKAAPLPMPGEDHARAPENARYDCRFGRIDETAFPHRLWRSVQQDALLQTGALQRGEAQGELPLRLALCGYLKRLRGVTADPSRVVIGPGLEWLILSLLPLFPEEARFGMEDPGYTPYRKLLKSYGRNVVTVPSRGGGVDGAALRAAMPHVLYLSPSHRFPLGGVLSAGARREALKWAEETGAVILEDDYDSELRYRGLPIPSLQSMDGGGRVIYLGSFSECLAPGLRIGYMVLPPGFPERWRESRIACAVPVPAQLALAAFIREGHLERHVSKMRTLYRRRREALLELLKPLESRVAAEDDGAGLFVRLRLKMPGTEERYLRLAADAGVRLTGVSQFYDAPDERHIRLLFGFGGLRDDELRGAIKSLHEAWLG
ncbi:MAG: PLP-dependent aminotransferase family protein [Oscillospiraceae bacterium]|jgi:GntR family transcriptional regulator/MocR family aminotransferase|nr:PLP-dependent aminotransferase family protein [Oscillospiraceae bacterium]